MWAALLDRYGSWRSLYRRRTPSLTTWQLVAASYLCVITLAVLKASGVQETNPTDSRWDISHQIRLTIDTAAASACATQTLVLALKSAYNSAVKRTPVLASAMYCGLATLTYILDSQDLLYRPYGLELGLLLLVISAAAMGFLCLGTLIALRHGDDTANTVIRQGDIYGACLWLLLWPVPRYFLKLSHESQMTTAVGSTVCCILLLGFAILARRAIIRITKVLDLHWVVLASGSAVYVLWCMAEIVHVLIAAGVPIPAGFALAALALVVVLQYVQLSLLISQSMMSFEQAARFKVERDAVHASLAMRIKEQQQARRAEEARQRFARYVFHELRVPLNSVDMGLGMLHDDTLEAMRKGATACTCDDSGCCRRGSTTQKSSQFVTLRLPADFVPTLEAIIKASSSMKVIINDTLDLTKMKNGGFKVSLSGTDLRYLIDETITGLSSMAHHPDHSVQMNCIIDPRLPAHVLADKVRLQQVIANLLSNAIKFAPHDGGGQVTVIVSLVDGGVPMHELSREEKVALANMPVLDMEGVSWKPQEGSSVGSDGSSTQSSCVGAADDSSVARPGHLAVPMNELPSVSSAIDISSQDFPVSCAHIKVDLECPPPVVAHMHGGVGCVSTSSLTSVTAGPPQTSAEADSSQGRDEASNSSRKQNRQSAPSDALDIPSAWKGDGAASVPDVLGIRVTQQLTQSLLMEGFSLCTSRAAKASEDDNWTDSTRVPYRQHPSQPASSAVNVEYCTLLIAVMDNGEGFPPADTDLLFSAFRQLDAGKQYKGKGTGLGLVICRELVSLHGGRMGVRSLGIPGKGAEFYVVLKLPVLQRTARGASTSCVRSTHERGTLAGGSWSPSRGSVNDETPTTFRSQGSIASSSDRHGRQDSAGHGRPFPLDTSHTQLSLPAQHSPVLGSLPASPRQAILHYPLSEPPSPETGTQSAVVMNASSEHRDADASLTISHTTVRRHHKGHPYATANDCSSLAVPVHSGCAVKCNAMTLASPGSAHDGTLCDGVAITVSRLVDAEPRTIRLLLVDDVVDNRRLLRRALSRMLASRLGPSVSIHVDEAEDGLVAVKLVQAEAPYDVIAMDAEMPVMSGFTATATIRSFGYQGMIFGCTGNALEEDVALFRAQGADDVFIKPLDLKGLCVAIVKGLDHKRDWCEGTTTLANDANR